MPSHRHDGGASCADGQAPHILLPSLLPGSFVPQATRQPRPVLRARPPHRRYLSHSMGDRMLAALAQPVALPRLQPLLSPRSCGAGTRAVTSGDGSMQLREVVRQFQEANPAFRNSLRTVVDIAIHTSRPASARAAGLARKAGSVSMRGASPVRVTGSCQRLVTVKSCAA